MKLTLLDSPEAHSAYYYSRRQRFFFKLERKMDIFPLSADYKIMHLLIMKIPIISYFIFKCHSDMNWGWGVDVAELFKNAFPSFSKKLSVTQTHSPPHITTLSLSSPTSFYNYCFPCADLAWLHVHLPWLYFFGKVLKWRGWQSSILQGKDSKHSNTKVLVNCTLPVLIWNSINLL